MLGHRRRQVEDIPATFFDRFSAGAPLHHRPPVDRLKVDVEADFGQNVGRDLRLGPNRRIIGSREDDNFCAAIAGGGQVLFQFGIILGAASNLDAGGARHWGSRHEQTNVGLIERGCRSGDALHDLFLVDRGDHHAADRGVVERRVQVVEPQAANLAGTVLYRNGDVLVGLYLRQQIKRRVFPPVDLTALECGRGGGGVGNEIPYHPIDVDDLRTGIEAGRAVLARHIGGVFGEYGAGAGNALVCQEFERTAADRLGDLLEGIGLGQPRRHDGAIDLGQSGPQQRERLVEAEADRGVRRRRDVVHPRHQGLAEWIAPGEPLDAGHAVARQHLLSVMERQTVS